MIVFFFIVSFLKIIPEEFKAISEMALHPKKTKLGESQKYDDVLLPGVPLVSDGFFGIVSCPLFGDSIKELNGFAISENGKHIAIVINRSSNIGETLNNEVSMFADKINNRVLSLSNKFADDGKVSIFNTSTLEFFQVFDRFELTLPSFDAGCTGTGSHFGGRCYASANYNWDETSKLPKPFEVPDTIGNHTNKYIKFYAGLYGKVEASIIIKKTGDFSLQAELDSSIDIMGGAGFRIRKQNLSQPLINIPFEKYEKKLGETTISIFGLNLEAIVHFITEPTLNSIKVDIPNDITFIKRFHLSLKKGFDFSNKHKISDDFEKSFRIETAYEDGKELVDDKEEYYADINANFEIKAGLRINLSFVKTLQASLGAGFKAGFEAEYVLDTAKCTSPSMYGTFVPYIKSYFEGGGGLKILSKSIFSFGKTIDKVIWNKTIGVGQCMYDDDDSKENDKDLIDESNRIMDIYQFNNFKPKDLSSPSYFIHAFFGKDDVQNEETEDNLLTYFRILGNDNGILYPGNLYFILPSVENLTNLLVVTQAYREGITPSEPIGLKISKNEQIEVDDNIMSFVVSHNTSRPISMGFEFTFKSPDEFINYRLGSKGLKKVGLIYKSEKGYHTNTNDYSIINEYNSNTDIFSDESIAYEHVQIDVQITLKNDYDQQIVLLALYPKKDEQDEQDEDELISALSYSKKNNMYQKDLQQNITLKLHESNGVIIIVILKIVSSEGTIIDEFSINRRQLENDFTVDLNNSMLKININKHIFPEYILQMKETLNITPLKGIVTEIHDCIDPKTKEREEFNGESQEINVAFEEKNVYGIFRFYFLHKGEDFDNLYALIKLPKIQPLGSNAKLIDEEDLYLLKLVMNDNLIKTKPDDDNDQHYDIMIPFRRKMKDKDDEITCKLSQIFQSPENNDHSPFCSITPTFSLKLINNFYVGCIQSYPTEMDKKKNIWEYFIRDETNNNFKIVQDYAPKGGLTQLYFLKARESILDDGGVPKNITVIAKQKYLIFPDSSRTLTIDNEIMDNLKEYCTGEYLYIKCDRCNKIFIGEIYSQNVIEYEKLFYRIYIDKNINKSITLAAYCDKNETSYCAFEFDMSSDGIALLEYNINNPMILGSEQDTPQSYPGVEEIILDEEVNETNDKVETRLDIGYYRQFISNRSRIYATKTWNGPITKRIVNIENEKLTISVSHKTVKINNKDYLEIILTEKDNEIILPFSSKKFYSIFDDSHFNSLMSQLGINIQKPLKDVTEEDITINSEGNIVVLKSFINENELKEKVNGKTIDLIDIPKEKFTLLYQGSLDPAKKKKLSTGAIIGIAIGSVAAAALLITGIVCLALKKKNDGVPFVTP